MPNVNGSFAGKIGKRNALPMSDLPNHEMSLAEVTGTQKSPDPLWNNGKLTYWGVTELLDGKGTQRGYYSNVHEKGGRDWGTFEGRVTTTGGLATVEGTWKITGGDGDFRGASGSGKFKTTMKSETDLECTWEGAYELAKAQAR